jgi:hypothetical protein
MWLLIPSWLDLATWAGVLFATLALIGFGRLLSAGAAALPEVALVAGWGAAAFLLTLWGVATPVSLRWLATAIAICGVLGLLLPWSRLTHADWRALGRVAVVALPLVALLASARPSLPDTFLNLLPNAAYLYDHGRFPADALAPAYSFLPAAPYNLQLAALIAGLVTPGFPASAMIGLNLVLQLAAGLLLARLVAGAADAGAARPPSWAATALGFLLAMALNPGFVPRYHLSAYSEPSVSVALAFAGWLGGRLLDGTGSRRTLAMTAWLLALTLAALVNIKQDSVALALGLVVSLLIIAAADRNARRRRTFGLLTLAALPAAVVYLAWRWYVLTHFAAGELKPQPLAQWQLDALPLILWHMAGAIGEKVTFFGTLAAVFVVLVWQMCRDGFGVATRVAALLLGVFLVYNAALVFAYVAHFPGAVGADAHSYFRYNTHLSLLMMVAIVLLLREMPGLGAWLMQGRLRRFAPALLILVSLASPIVFLRFLRFDLEVPQQRLWTLAHEAATRIGDHDRLALVLPGDNGSVEAMLEGLLRFTPPRRPDLTLVTVQSFDEEALDAGGVRLALISCTPAGIVGIPAGEAALVERGATGWGIIAAWPYPTVPPRAHWSKVLAEAPLCLAG